jgi:hypothetical protein
MLLSFEVIRNALCATINELSLSELQKQNPEPRMGL